MSPRINWFIGSVTICLSSAAVGIAQQSSFGDGAVSPNQAATRRYLPGETYYESNLNRTLESSENALEREYRQTAEARQLLLKALVAHRIALLEYGKTKAQLERQYDNSPELFIARREVAVAEQQYQATRAAVIQQLQESPEYRELVALRQKLSLMLHDHADEPITSVARQQIAKQLAETLSLMKELEEEALNQDRGADESLRRRSFSLDQVARKKSESLKSMTADSRFTAAKLAKERTQNNIQVQRREYAGNLNQFAKTQQGYQQLVQQKLLWEQSQRHSRMSNFMPNNWPHY